MKKMWIFTKTLFWGIKMGLKWDALQCARNKWYIIPFIIDVVLLPVKIPIVLMLCLVKPLRKYMDNTGNEIISEIEESEES